LLKSRKKLVLQIANCMRRQIKLLFGDITNQKVDAIVNAANSSLMGGGGVDGAIHRAGGPKILAECKVWVAKHGRLPTGQAMLTCGGNLPAKYIIHTVGPVWRDGKHGEPELLRSAYFESLKLAASHGNIKIIAFPSISTGAYRFPLALAAPIAIQTVQEFLKEKTSIEEVRIVLFSEETYQAYQNFKFV
jgi:O-acetyl-ADP-ribose deacetylase (regulator of RNase III)